MNKNNNTEEIKDAKGEVVRTLVFTDKDGVRTYKDKDTGETVRRSTSATAVCRTSRSRCGKANTARYT